MKDAPWRPTPALAMGLGKILAAQTTGRLHLVHSLLTSLKGSTMIMLLTQDSELREQLTEALQQSGHKVAIPAHRENILTMLETLALALSSWTYTYLIRADRTI
jgi:hypothetical protein